MKLNGALKPHHGAPPPPPVNGSSFGIKKYRDKKRECSSAAPPTTTKQQQQPKQQHQQQLQVVEVEKKEQEQGEKEEKSIVFNITTIITRQYTNNNNNNGSNNHCENVKETIQTVASSNKICNKNAITSTTAATNIKCNDDNNNNNNNNNNTNKIIEILCNSKNSNIFATNADKCKMSTKIDNETEAVADTADCRYHCRSLAASSSSLPSLSSSSSLSSSLPLQSRLRCATAILSQSTSLPPALLNESVGSSSRIVNVAAELMGRAQQSLKQQLLSCSNTTITIMNVTSSPAMKLAAILCLLYATVLLPTAVRCDENDNFFAVNSFSIGPETTTPEFDYASRGQKKFGDKCENTLECGFPGSICDPKKKSCQCTEDLPVTNHFDKCGKEAAVNESCFFNEQCEMKYFQTECRDGRCVCRFEMSPAWGKDGTVECKGRQEKRGPGTYIDPAMIGVLVGMALMFIIICVVLRLFSQARWRENRTIFNTPNPRLMNVSLLRDSKLLHGQERRGSRMSVRAPSRQPSMVSLRPHSPNPSLGKTGRMTRSKSNTRSSESRVSDVSNCSRLLEHPHNAHHIPHTHSYTHTIHNVPTPPHSAALTPNAYAAASAAAAAAANTTNSHHHHQHHHHNTITTTTTYVAASSPGGDADPDTNTSPCDLTLDAPPAVAIQMNKF